MAKISMFTVYDSKVEAYLPPFYTRSIGEALRSWEEAVNDPNTAFAKHPADFTLFHIGTFEDSTAQMELFDAKRAISNALEAKRTPAAPTPLFSQPQINEVPNQGINQ